MARPLLLPRLQPVGDVDEDELAFDEAGADIPPAIAPLRRQLLLAQLIMARDRAGGQWSAPAPALALAADSGAAARPAAYGRARHHGFRRAWPGEQFADALAGDTAISGDHRHGLAGAAGGGGCHRSCRPAQPAAARARPCLDGAAAADAGHRRRHHRLDPGRRRIAARPSHGLPQGAIILPGFRCRAG